MTPDELHYSRMAWMAWLNTKQRETEELRGAVYRLSRLDGGGEADENDSPLSRMVKGAKPVKREPNEPIIWRNVAEYLQRWFDSSELKELDKA